MDKKRNRKDLCDTLKAGEPAVGYDSTVMSPLEERHCQRKMKSGAEVFRIMEKLRGFLNLKTGWDGYQALPVNHHVIDNLYAALDECEDEDMFGWQIYPEINGTLSLQNDELKAGLHIGTEAFSYFVIHDDKVSGADNVLFSVPVFLTTLRDING